MDSEQFRRIRSVFQAVRASKLADRNALLEELCNGDVSLRVQVERLIDAETEATCLLDGSIDVRENNPTPVTELSTALRPGTLLCHRYQIDGLIDEGGMGAVYKARDVTLTVEAPEEVLAVKVILPKLSDRPDLVRRFKQEILLTRQVTQKNVIRVHNFEQDGETVFFTMEFIAGNDLATLLKRKGPYPPNEAARIICDVAHAIEAAHEKQVIHRDVKPRNIMIENGGRVVVMDFGLARRLRRESGTVTEMIMGTPGYMAPETLRGYADHRSDLYSLGVTFHELLTGDLPPQNLAVVKRVPMRAEEPPPAEPIPGPLQRIVDKCLEESLDHRYQSASDVIADLQKWLNPPPVASKIRKPEAAILITAVCVLLALVVGFLGRQRTPAPPHPSVSVLIADFRNETGDPVFSAGTLESVLGVSLESASFITSFDRAQAHKEANQLSGDYALTEPVANTIAVREGIHEVIVGSLTRDEGRYFLSVRVLDTRTAKSFSASRINASTREEVLTSITKVAASIRKALGDTANSAPRGETFTAATLDAVHAYALAQDLALKGDGTQAIAEYRRAITLDPNFGRAYAGLAVFYRNNNQISEALKWYQLALAHSDRMTNREKYRTRGGYFITESNPDKAIEEFTDLTNRYPADNAGFANLALAWFMKRDFAKALDYGQKAVQIYPKNVVQRNNVAFYYMYAGNFPGAMRAADDAISLNQAYAKSYVVKALSKLAQDDVDGALKEYQDLRAVVPSGTQRANLGLADTYLYEGRPEEALAVLRSDAAGEQNGQKSSPSALSLATLAECYLRIGNIPLAVKTAQQAAAIGRNPGTLFSIARIYIAAGQPKMASEVAKELSQARGNDSKAYAVLINGEVSLESGNIEQAISVFEEAQKIADTWLGHFDLGRAYIAAGEFTEADSDLEKCVQRRGEATAAFLDDNPSYRYFAPVLYYHARAEQGEHSPSAVEIYRRFLATTGQNSKDVLVLDARRRLTSLLQTPTLSAQQQDR